MQLGPRHSLASESKGHDYTRLWSGNTIGSFCAVPDNTVGTCHGTVMFRNTRLTAEVFVPPSIFQGRRSRKLSPVLLMICDICNSVLPHTTHIRAALVTLSKLSYGVLSRKHNCP